MSDHTNPSNTNAAEAQFLAPETLQQAGGEELHRFFSVSLCALVSVRADGVTLKQNLGGGWRVHGTKKPEVPLSVWVDAKRKAFALLPSWQRGVDELPTMDEVAQWVSDSVCSTPTGHDVEPDGEGPDGVPSWLRVLGLV